MKYIIAIIKPNSLEQVRQALSNLDIAGMTVSEVRGYGRQKGQSEIYRGNEYSVQFIPKLKLEIASPAALCARTVEAVTQAASNGSIGDGKIFVLDLEDAIRIRTGESGADAL